MTSTRDDPPAEMARCLARRFGVAASGLSWISDTGCLIHKLSIPEDPRLRWRGLCGSASLRLYPAGTPREDIATEMLWLTRLQDEPDVRVPRPLPALDDTLIQAIDGDADEPPRHGVLLSWVEGKPLDRELDPHRLQLLGRAVAGMHAVSVALARSAQIASRRPAFAVQPQDWQHIAPAWRDLLSAADVRVLGAALGKVQDVLGGMAPSAQSHGLIHTDLHQRNILFDGDCVGVIDFSDWGWGHHAYDIASALAWIKHPWLGNCDHGTSIGALEQAFLAGYRSKRDLPEGLENHLPTFVAARFLSFLQWALLEWPSPTAYFAWGPSFADKAIDHLRRYASS